MIEQGLAQQRMWKAGSASDQVASGDFLPGCVEREARTLVEEMQDVIPLSVEIDRSIDVV